MRRPGPLSSRSSRPPARPGLRSSAGSTCGGCTTSGAGAFLVAELWLDAGECPTGRPGGSSPTPRAGGIRQRASRQCPAGVPVASHLRPATVPPLNLPTSTTGEKCPTTVPRVSHLRPTTVPRVSTRALIHPHLHPHLHPHQQHRGTRIPVFRSGSGPGCARMARRSGPRRARRPG